MPKFLIVTRHQGAINFIRAELPEFAEAPVLSTVAEEDVAGKVVAGILPLHLAAAAKEVYIIGFPNGRASRPDLTKEEMEAEGAFIRRFIVLDDAKMKSVVQKAIANGFSGPEGLF